MLYQFVEQGFFLKRLNRFSALVRMNDKEELVHVKNTGRLGELLLPGATVYLQHSDNPLRKTQWDLISVENGGQVVNIDSQAPNKIFGEWVESGGFRSDVCAIQPEYTYEDSRFDFRLECENSIQFVEIQGVTLLRDGCACFPDAPTQRGVKHLNGLIRAVWNGYEAAAVFLIQMKGASCLRPNDDTDPAFGTALREAAANGVQVYAFDCCVTADSLRVDRPVPVELSELQQR